MFFNLQGLLFKHSQTFQALVVIGLKEGSNAEAIPRKAMASRLMINSKVVQALLLEAGVCLT